MMKIKNVKILSNIAFLLTLIGSINVGIGILLSELAYPNIDELTSCPIGYQIYFYISIGVSLLGIVMSILFKRKTKYTMIAIIIESAFIVLGFILLCCALSRIESYVLDVLICVGGLMVSIGLFTIVSSLIGRSRTMDEHN